MLKWLGFDRKMIGIMLVYLNKYVFGVNIDVGRRFEKMNIFFFIFGLVKDIDFERCF